MSVRRRPDPAGSPWLTMAEVVQVTRFDTRTIRRWVDVGYLAAYRMPNGHYRFRRTDVDALFRPVPAEEAKP